MNTPPRLRASALLAAPLSARPPSPVWPAVRRGAALVLVALLAGCIAPSDNPNPPVPPLQTEARPLPPVSAEPLSWQPGHWNWNGGQYVWEPGRYVPAEGHGLNWMPGYWQHTDSGWVWRPAHWV